MKSVNDLSFEDLRLKGYITHDIKEVGVITYIGAINREDKWLFRKIDETSGTNLSFATDKNNPSIKTYTSALANYSTLTYGYFNQAF